MKMLVTNRKITLSILMVIVLLCGLQGMSYAQDDSPAVKLQAGTEQVLTEANAKNFVVTLVLEGAAWAEISSIRPAVSVSGIDGVEIKKERYNTGRTERVWVCTSNCGAFVEWGYWVREPIYAYRPSILRKSDTVLEVPLTFDTFDFDAEAMLTFTVEADAIVDYKGEPLTAIMPVITAVPAPLPLTEQNLGGSVARFTLTGGRYAAQLPEGAVTVSGINGVGVSDVVRKSDTVLEVPLTFDGTDFDVDTALIFSVEAGSIADYIGDAFTAEILVSAIKEVVSASVVSPLTEATLDGSIVTLLLTAAAFEQDISKIREAVSVSGIDGVTVDTATLQRLSDRKVTVELIYDSTDFGQDTALTFTLTSKAIANHNGELTTEVPVTANRGEDLLTIFWIDWVDWGKAKIQRANLDLANLDLKNIEDLVTQGFREPRDIALDVAGGKMYWTDAGADKIRRANLDGSNVEDLVTHGLDGLRRIALDVAGGKMYWTDAGADKIQRANLDGSNIEDLVTGLSAPYGIALDVAGGKMYWTDWRTDKIQRANLDGSNIKDLVTHGLDGPNDIALDVAGGKMYWADWRTDKIQRANLDGSNVEDLVTQAQGLFGPGGIALDVEGGKMYFSNLGEIQRANLDGSNVEDLVTGLDSANSIVIVSSSLVNPTTDSTIAKEDVNRDGVVDVQDLAYVGLQYGKTGTNAADVNGDGIVNVDDFVLVAAAIDAADAAAPAARAQMQSHFTAAQLQAWLTEARASGNTSRTYQRGIAVIEQLLALLTLETTALLANYPNPFNPETWIPYQLSKPASVTLTIYDIQGHVVRTLELGHQRAGIYKTRSRAAYWDGRNQYGEPVASGLYFYTLSTESTRDSVTAGDFSATRKMLIRK